MELTPAQLSSTLRVVDDVTRQDTQFDTLARFTVQSARQRVERV